VPGAFVVVKQAVGLMVLTVFWFVSADGVLVSYSEREARGCAILALTSLDLTDEYVLSFSHCFFLHCCDD
jgi:hypothetical protein